MGVTVPLEFLAGLFLFEAPTGRAHLGSPEETGGRGCPVHQTVGPRREPAVLMPVGEGWGLSLPLRGRRHPLLRLWACLLCHCAKPKPLEFSCFVN